MKLERIRLKRVPGIDPEFTIEELSPGINIVIGPNGSGKTSFRNAVAATLWPSAHPSKSLEIRSDWKDDERHFEASRDGGGVSWVVDDSNAEAPALPPAHLEQCYTLGVSDLLLSDNSADQAIAREIRVAMSGGYDLSEVSKKHFELKSRFGKSERKAFESAQDTYKRVCRDQRELAAAEKRLVDLRADAEAAKVAERLIPKIDDSLKLAGLRRRLSLVGESLDRLPAEVARVSATDGERLDQLTESDRGFAEKIKEFEGRIEEHRTTITESGLDDQLLSRSDLEAASTRLAELSGIWDSLSGARTRRNAAAATVESTKRALAGGVALDAVPDVSAEALGLTGKLLRKRESERATRVALEQEIAALQGRNTTDDARQLEAGAGTLRDWLAAPVAAGDAVPAWMVVMACVIGLLGFALSALHHPYWLLLAGAGVGIAVGLFALPRGSRDGSDERHRHSQRFGELKLGRPEEWSPEHVRTLLRELDGRLSNALLGDAAEDRLELLATRLSEHETSESVTDGERETLLAEIGIELEDDLALHEVAARCRQYLVATAALDSEKAEVEHLENKLEGPGDAIDRLLNAHGYGAAADNAERAARLKALEHRLDSYTTAVEQLTTAKADLDSEQARLATLNEQIEAFYEERGLAAGNRRQLDALLEELPEYTRLKGEQEGNQRLLRELESRLEDHAELVALGEDQLNQRRDAATAKSSTLSEVDQEIGAIEQRVKDAIEGSDVESALADVAIQRDLLLEAGEKAELAAAGSFLLGRVDEDHERASRPVVLERAMQYFAAFTHNAFELILGDGDDGGFRARSTTTGDLLELAQLSEGTRIQLLLAVRLAFATSAERGSSIPLILDEALSTSDPERFLAVAEALAVLAADGRQIFYLTSNPADVAAWIAAARSDTAMVPAVIDIGRIRWDQAAVKSIDELKLPRRATVPKPEGMTPEQYGVALGVPPARVHAPIEALHLFHLLRDDRSLLHELLAKYRIDTVGKWISFSKLGRAEKLLTPQACKRLDALCDGGREIQRAVSVGWGKPVDSQALEESGAVTGTFMPVLQELIGVVGGEAETMLGIIDDPTDDRVKSFRKKNRADLFVFFEEHGHIDSRPRLGISDVYARTLAGMEAAIDEGVVAKDDCLALVDRLVGAFRS